MHIQDGQRAVHQGGLERRRGILVRPDVHARDTVPIPVLEARLAPLVGRQRRGEGVGIEVRIARVNGGAAGDQCVGERPAAVVPQQRFQNQRRIDTDQVAVAALSQPTATARADQVVGTGDGDRAADVTGRGCALQIAGDDRIAQGDAARGGVDSAARAAGRVAVQGTVGDRQRAPIIEDAATARRRIA